MPPQHDEVRLSLEEQRKYLLLAGLTPQEVDALGFEEGAQQEERQGEEAEVEFDMNRFREDVVPQPPSPQSQEPPQEDPSAERQAAFRERRRKLVEEARKQLRANPVVQLSAPLPLCPDDIPAGFHEELVVWERQEREKDPFTFSFLLPKQPAEGLAAQGDG